MLKLYSRVRCLVGVGLPHVPGRSLRLGRLPRAPCWYSQRKRNRGHLLEPIEHRDCRFGDRRNHTRLAARSARSQGRDLREGACLPLFLTNLSFHAAHELLLQDDGKFDPPADLKAHTFTGTWKRNLEADRFMRSGGACTVWEALSPRMRPADFQRRSLLGFGDDWPRSATRELEEYYCQSEELLGVAGTNEDNPFAPASVTALSSTHLSRAELGRPADGPRV